jgi:NADH dehydrogenase
MPVRHRVVILGGGFGGLYAAKGLRGQDVDVTLIDRRNYHLFQPLLYQVATGSLAPGEIAAPLRAVLRKQKNARVWLAEATSIDPAARNLILKDGSIPYDSLIVACGAQSHYFGHDDWEAVSPGLKSLEDAMEVRRKVLYAFEAAEREPDPARRKAWLTFVIAGGGPTGVELAGALAEIAHDTLRSDFRSIHPEEAEILLVEGDTRLLTTFPERLSSAAEQSLAELGVLVRTKMMVTGIDQDGVTLAGSGRTERVESRTVIWAAGVAPSSFGEVLAKQAGAQLDREGRVMVGPDLTIAGHPEIFVIGDLAHVASDTGPLPGVAPVAMQQGAYAAQAIVARLRGETVAAFHYHNKGNLAVIGRAAGVADFGTFGFHGVLAWLLWLFVHLMYLAGFQNRLLVFLRWGFQYLTFSHGSRLITGPPLKGEAE